MALYWTRYHHVTRESDSIDADTTIEGDDNIYIWHSGDPAVDAADEILEEPDGGFTWRTSLSGWEQYPNGFAALIPDKKRDEEIKRIPVAETSLVD